MQAVVWRLPLRICKNIVMNWRIDCWLGLMLHHRDESCLQWENVLKYCHSSIGVPVLCNTMLQHDQCLLMWKL
uniref:SEC10 n=1 Tax=Arundo donax TaxID=35708 RepID=A0A0A9DT71_ARUDO